MKTHHGVVVIVVGGLIHHGLEEGGEIASRKIKKQTNKVKRKHAKGNSVDQQDMRERGNVDAPRHKNGTNS